MAVVRFNVSQQGAAEFVPRARTALEALAGCPGYSWGGVGPATDDPQIWVMVTRWDSVGQYRRGLSSYDVKLRAHPLLYEAIDEPSAFEELLALQPGGVVVEQVSDRAVDAGTAGPLGGGRR